MNTEYHLGFRGFQSTRQVEEVISDSLCSLSSRSPPIRPSVHHLPLRYSPGMVMLQQLSLSLSLQPRPPPHYAGIMQFGGGCVISLKLSNCPFWSRLNLQSSPSKSFFLPRGLSWEHGSGPSTEGNTLLLSPCAFTPPSQGILGIKRNHCCLKLLAFHLCLSALLYQAGFLSRSTTDILNR